MLTLVFPTSPRCLSPEAPYCEPCPWPISLPDPDLPARRRFHVKDHLQAAQRCAALAQVHPTWPQSRVRATVARELKLSTITLRYLLGQADALTQQDATPEADASALAA